MLNMELGILMRVFGCDSAREVFSLQDFPFRYFFQSNKNIFTKTCGYALTKKSRAVAWYLQEQSYKECLNDKHVGGVPLIPPQKVLKN